MNFEEALKLVGRSEGGFTKNPKDPGNWTGGKVGVGELKGTKRGISAAAYPHLDIEHLSDADINSIYRNDYWAEVRGDELPGTLCYTVFDTAVNSGPKRAVMFLQKAVGVKDDGDFGKVTMAAVNALPEDKVELRFNSIRLRFMASLKVWDDFSEGWANRIADNLWTAGA